jgi:hypothetical protein
MSDNAKKLIFSFLLGIIIMLPTEAKDLLAIVDLICYRTTTVSRADIDSICEKIVKTAEADGHFDVFDRKYFPLTLESVGLFAHPLCADTTCLLDIGEKITAKFVIGGSIMQVNNGMRIVLIFVNVETKSLVRKIDTVLSTDKKKLMNVELPMMVRDLIAVEKPLRLAKAESGDDQTNMASQERPSRQVGKKNTWSNILVYIGTPVCIAGSIVAYVYWKMKNGGTKNEQGNDENGDLSIGDAPGHE